jgi:pantoate--beta-alanine ligase
MDIVRTVSDLREHVRAWRADRFTAAVVPTMGGLHEGHVTLVREGLVQADRVIATIFVNPTQFGASEDLSSYPRQEAADAAMLADAGCSLLFAPDVTEMYPPGFSTRVIVDGLTECLCGATRPGHFDGVSQVVSKLLNQAQCDFAMFGEKDWQQMRVVTRMARDLDIPTRIVPVATVREADGLAMSSRNRYLTDEERATAARLPALLREAAAGVAAGGDPSALCADVARGLVDAGFRGVDYCEVRTADDLKAVGRFDPDVPARIFVAAKLGKARLIDNMPVG